MICRPCRDRNHPECDAKTKTVGIVTAVVSFSSFCDCQHVTEGENINRELVPKSPVRNV